MFPNETVVVHIGLQKTASTYLQHTLWPELYPEMVRIVHGRRKVRTTSTSAIELINNMQFSDYCPVPLISCEKLSGKLLPNHPGESIEVFDTFIDAVSRARVKPRILILLRPQAQWLQSAFRYVAKEGNRGTFPSYLRRFSLEDLSWKLRVQKLLSRRIPVRVLPYSLLKEEPVQAFKEMAEYCGRRLSAPTIQRIVNMENPRSNRSPRSVQALTIAAKEVRLRRAIKRITRYDYGSSVQEKLIEVVDRLVENPSDFSYQIPEDLRKRLSADYTEAIRLASRR